MHAKRRHAKSSQRRSKLCCRMVVSTRRVRQYSYWTLLWSLAGEGGGGGGGGDSTAELAAGTNCEARVTKERAAAPWLPPAPP